MVVAKLEYLFGVLFVKDPWTIFGVPNFRKPPKISN